MTATPHESRPSVAQPRADDTERGRVIDFRRPRGAPKPAPLRSPLAPPLLDLGKYEQPAEQDDYRRRMVINSVGMVISILLILVGIWLATKIAELRRDTDCVLSGQRNCDAISINNSISR
jgi:hypothetical protein